MLQLCAVGDIMKIRIKTIVTNKSLNEENSFETKGILSNNIITYYENDIKMSLDLKERVLKRRTNDYEIILDFLKKKCFYIMNNNTITLDIKVNEINDEFYVDYEIEDNRIVYNLNYEVI